MRNPFTDIIQKRAIALLNDSVISYALHLRHCVIFNMHTVPCVFNNGTRQTAFHASFLSLERIKRTRVNFVVHPIVRVLTRRHMQRARTGSECMHVNVALTVSRSPPLPLLCVTSPSRKSYMVIFSEIEKVNYACNFTERVRNFFFLFFPICTKTCNSVNLKTRLKNLTRIYTCTIEWPVLTFAY